MQQRGAGLQPTLPSNPLLPPPCKAMPHPRTSPLHLAYSLHPPPPIPDAITMPPVPQTPQALNLNTTSSLTLLALVLLLLALPSSLYLLARYDVINSRISRSTSPPITFSRLSFSTTHLITIQFNVRPAPLPSTNPYDHTSIFENPEWHLYPFRQVSPNVTIYQ